MEFLNRCNGISLNMNRPRVTLAANFLFGLHIKACRDEFQALGMSQETYYTGPRYRDDNTVLDRIFSAVPDTADFIANPKAWILDALRDSAFADHWYEFEKEW